MFITLYDAPEKRRRYADGGIEHKFTEAAVMLAYASHLMAQSAGACVVSIHPDGEHAKVFDIAAFLLGRGFVREKAIGTTPYGGQYRQGEHTIIVNPSSGRGDVVGEIDGRRVVAECKGGTINSTHAGQKSRLRKGLAELVGQLMVREPANERQVAVLPYTTEVERLSLKLAPRCKMAGIEIALVHADGMISYVPG
ncbi:hypothetical protein [Mesorhizobium sp. ES1-4]|uniref:hypothetical protein n=1 Tax=Mesorhizobium sp. ES1-4 TaxID=2876627 RepID=UPI001CCF17F7|nr:hypothetical protein [Mesorhizobium sp. ES1-4]MBZ9798809.1 hypothetical protein [Mesorhizobium sp. ES1-4]